MSISPIRPGSPAANQSTTPSAAGTPSSLAARLTDTQYDPTSISADHLALSSFRTDHTRTSSSAHAFAAEGSSLSSSSSQKPATNNTVPFFTPIESESSFMRTVDQYLSIVSQAAASSSSQKSATLSGAGSFSEYQAYVLGSSSVAMSDAKPESLQSAPAKAKGVPEGNLILMGKLLIRAERGDYGNISGIRQFAKMLESQDPTNPRVIALLDRQKQVEAKLKAISSTDIDESRINVPSSSPISNSALLRKERAALAIAKAVSNVAAATIAMCAVGLGYPITPTVPLTLSLAHERDLERRTNIQREAEIETKKIELKQSIIDSTAKGRDAIELAEDFEGLANFTVPLTLSLAHERDLERRINIQREAEIETKKNELKQSIIDSTAKGRDAIELAEDFEGLANFMDRSLAGDANYDDRTDLQRMGSLRKRISDDFGLSSKNFLSVVQETTQHKLSDSVRLFV